VTPTAIPTTMMVMKTKTQVAILRPMLMLALVEALESFGLESATIAKINAGMRQVRYKREVPQHTRPIMAKMRATIAFVLWSC
jgi:hypothetical protein